MSKLTINRGTLSNDGTGDSLRDGADKINSNFSEVYNKLGDGSNLLARDIDFGENKIFFSNTVQTVQDLTSLDASKYVGMIVHVQGTGSLYYAHSNSWRKLLTDNSASNVPQYLEPLSTVAYSGDYNSLLNLPTIPTNITDIGIEDGSAGQVLTTDGTGNFIFRDVVATSIEFNDVLNKPTTLAGYGITDAFNGNYLELFNKPDLFSGNYLDLTNTPEFDQDLKTTDIVRFAGLATSVISTTGLSSIFHRVASLGGDGVTDTGLNIRSNSNGDPIYIYNYGSDGNGTGSGEVDVTSTGVDIWSKYGFSNHKWQFTTLLDGISSALVTPTMAIAGVASTKEDQIISLNADHSLTIGSNNLQSYIRIYGSDQGNSSNLIKIVGQREIGERGSVVIEADAGSSRIEMGEIVLFPSHNFPPGNPVDTLYTTMDITGGTSFYGDVVISAGSQLGIRNSIIFQDGSSQSKAYTGNDITNTIDTDITINARYYDAVTAVATYVDGTGLIFQYDYSQEGDVGTQRIQAGWLVTGTIFEGEFGPGVEVLVASDLGGITQIAIADGQGQFILGETYTFTDPTLYTNTSTFGTDGSLTVPGPLNIGNSRVIPLDELKTIVADSTDFANFKTRIAAL